MASNTLRANMIKRLGGRYDFEVSRIWFSYSNEVGGYGILSGGGNVVSPVM